MILQKSTNNRVNYRLIPPQVARPIVAQPKVAKGQRKSKSKVKESQTYLAGRLPGQAISGRPCLALCALPGLLCGRRAGKQAGSW